ncbi:MAG: hypothetical protein ACYS5V_11165 [Planctomycetota bacterium]
MSLLLDRRHFYNGTRYPIQINRLSIMGVNYTFNRVPEGAPVRTLQASTVINRCRLGISFPQRFHVNSKRFVLDAAIAPRPTWQPRPPDPSVPGQPGAGYPVSSLWGQSMLGFDKPLYLPIDGTITWQLSAINRWGDAAGGLANTIPVTMLYQEEGGLFGGSARTFQTQIQPFSDLNYVAENAQEIERWPYPVDPFQAPPTDGVGTRQWWAPETEFNGQIFDRQESTRAGSTKLTDMRCFIDQRHYDEELFDSAVGGAGTSPQPSAVSMRIGTRVRTRNAGSKEWWWRPGAPLALVFDKITPANVYKLPEPITLGPGEQVNIEMEFPAASWQPGGEVPPPPQPINFHVGVALNGYAAIEG